MTRATSELAHLFAALKAPAATRALPTLADRARAEEGAHSAHGRRRSRTKRSRIVFVEAPAALGWAMWRALDAGPRSAWCRARCAPAGTRGRCTSPIRSGWRTCCSASSRRLASSSRQTVARATRVGLSPRIFGRCSRVCVPTPCRPRNPRALRRRPRAKAGRGCAEVDWVEPCIRFKLESGPPEGVDCRSSRRISEGPFPRRRPAVVRASSLAASGAASRNEVHLAAASSDA